MLRALDVALIALEIERDDCRGLSLSEDDVIPNQADNSESCGPKGASAEPAILDDTSYHLRSQNLHPHPF